MNKNLTKLINEMVGVDQDLRLQAKPGKELINYMIYAIDAVHNYRIKEIVKNYGYPIQRMIGPKGMSDFWLLIQHQDYDLKLQEECLKNCDFSPENKAYLVDRVLVNKGQKQLYGTQLGQSIEDQKNVDKRRKSVGLEPLKQYLEKVAKFQRRYGK